MKTNFENLNSLPNRRSGFRQKAGRFPFPKTAALCRDAATKPIGTSLFNVRCWMLNVAVFATAASALAGVHYVDVNSPNATPPYTNWTTAATNIQDAVDAAVAADEVVVTNGSYAPLSVVKPLNIRSVNGPQFTTIFGGNPCAYLTNGATLSGFTLTHGGLLGYVVGANGRGLVCQSASAVVSDCVITGNYITDARDYRGGNAGAGALRGALINCILTGNHVFGSYAYGGGASGCTLNNCVLSGNSSGVPLGNLAGTPFTSGFGGGAAYCTLNNCILTRNSASSTANIYENVFANGGGAYACTLRNCIISDNEVYDHWFGAVSNDYDYSPYYPYSLSYLIYCEFVGPLFVDYAGGDLRLQPNSPCINAGDNAYAPSGLDLDGNPRIVGGRVDIGAYEYQWLSLVNFNVVSNQAGFNITGQSNQAVAVETSTDLLNWSPLATNTLNGHPFPFIDPTPATLPQRFYRAQAQ